MAARIRPATALALGSLLCAGWVTAVPGPLADSALPAATAQPAASAQPAADAQTPEQATTFHQTEATDWANPNARSTDPNRGINLQIRSITPPAQARGQPTPVHQTDAADWPNPNARSTDPHRGISLQIRSITPRFLSPEDTDPQTYSLRIRNTSPGTIRGLTLSLKTAPAAGS